MVAADLRVMVRFSAPRGSESPLDRVEFSACSSLTGSRTGFFNRQIVDEREKDRRRHNQQRPSDQKGRGEAELRCQHAAN